ncbi:MAG: RDD family protein [Pseudomonadota bacterium]
MTSIDQAQPTAVTAAQLDGVRTARVLAFVIDYVIIAVLCVPFAIIIAFLGVITLGLAWGLYAFLPAAVALLYLAITMGGDRQATVGMRMMGIKVFKLGGGPVDPFLAMLHGILFWVIHFTVFLLLVSFFSSHKRLLHDILLGTYMARDPS